MSRERVKRVVILGWREGSDWAKVVGYKDLKGLEELDRGVIGPNVREVVLEVVDKLSWSVVRIVIPDTEYCGICSMGVGLYEGMGCKESIGSINYKVKCKDDLFLVSSSPLEVMFGSYLNGTGFCKC